MSLPDLCLAPHEAGDLAPDEPLCAPAMARVRIGQLWECTTYLSRSVTTSAGLTELVARKDAANSPLLRFGNLQSTSRIVSYICEGRFERQLYLNACGQFASFDKDWEFRISINADGHSIWYCKNDRKSFEFKWKSLETGQHLSKEWRLQTSDAQIRKEIRGMLNDKNSDFSFAWRWAELSSREKNKFLYKIKNGTFETCEQILFATLWNDPMYGEKQDLLWSIGLKGIYNYPVDTYTLNYVLTHSFIEDALDVYPLNPRQYRVLELVLKHFALHQNRDATKNVVDSYVWPHSEFDCGIIVPIPTAHERLEAKLQLRDFLRDKVPSAEFAELISA